MDNPIVLPEGDLQQLPRELQEGFSLVYFKLVGVGPETYLQVCKGLKASKKIMSNVPSYYISSKKTDMRALLHEYVDKFCDAQGV